MKRRRPRNPSTKKWDADFMAAVLGELVGMSPPEEGYDDGFFWRLLCIEGRTFVLETLHGNFQVTVTCAPRTQPKRLLGSLAPLDDDPPFSVTPCSR